ncbi:MAG: 4-demethylwyosine synthase TYW1 [Candidatus Altiarchaeota archaeon]
MNDVIPQEDKKQLEKQHYKVVGGHSAAKICLWTRKSLRGEGVCYKEKFYGISSHRCLQMTPALQYCNHNCVFCWRTTNYAEPAKDALWDEPEDIVDGLIQAQRQLLSGFGGYEGVDKRKLEESKNPNQAAISLSGEPSFYPKLGGLIQVLQKRGFSTFLVSNGTMPEALEKLAPLPSQLYVSLVAPDEKTYTRVCNPLIPDGWSKVNKTLRLFQSLDTRKVVRLTLVKGVNMTEPQGYAKLIGKAEPDFIEAKAFMFLGGSRGRLARDNMPSHDEVREFAAKISEFTGYLIADEKEGSRVVLLGK